MTGIELYDTTLRDGAQMEGISISVDDKLAIAKRLDEIGFHYIEGGYAGANPKEDEFFRRVRELDLNQARITAFGNTRRADVRPEDDTTLKALLASEAQVVTLVGKASEMQVRDVLETSLEENLAMIADSVEYVKAAGRTVFFDAEHFFDGYKQNPDYALQAVRVAAGHGAETVILCDTNGGTMPGEIKPIVEAVKAAVDVKLGIHTHNDTDTAVASALAAVEGGVLQVQGCVNGYGERTGNANLISVAANLKLKLGQDVITDEQLASLTELSNFVAEVVNMPPHAYQAYVGLNAFSHKGGLHSAAVQKVEEAYQHIKPNLVGNSKGFVVSELAGRGTVLQRVRELGFGDDLTKEDARNIVNLVKEKENEGFQYERAAASFDLMIRRSLPNYEPPFELVDFRVLVENRGHGRAADGSQVTSEATVKVRVGEETLHTASEGNGPVNALDQALRKALLQTYPKLEVVRLTDYKVRVVSAGTDTSATVRVVIETSDGTETWQTVGASPNVLEASWLALADSMEYWLVRHAEENGFG
ncbi:MAG: citramalate synthase [Chloroflexi bacterium]|nr:citramalate synthase [Chloroflexota bacterium]